METRRCRQPGNGQFILRPSLDLLLELEQEDCHAGTAPLRLAGPDPADHLGWLPVQFPCQSREACLGPIALLHGARRDPIDLGHPPLQFHARKPQRLGMVAGPLQEHPPGPVLRRARTGKEQRTNLGPVAFGSATDGRLDRPGIAVENHDEVSEPAELPQRPHMARKLVFPGVAADDEVVMPQAQAGFNTSRTPRMSASAASSSHRTDSRSRDCP